MKRLPCIIVGIALVLTTYELHAAYFVIQLKNGNTLQTAKYWEEDSSVYFFMQGGSVGIPQSIIKHIVSSEGSTGNDSAYYPEAFMDDAASENLLEAAAMSDENQNPELANDLQDRINVIETNLTNLQKNKAIYQEKKEKYVRDKEKAQQKIENLTIRSSTYLSTDERQEKIEIERSKVADAEEKISDTDDRIQNTDTMIESQLRMRERLENELAKFQQ